MLSELLKEKKNKIPITLDAKYMIDKTQDAIMHGSENVFIKKYFIIVLYLF